MNHWTIIKTTTNDGTPIYQPIMCLDVLQPEDINNAKTTVDM